MYKEMKKDSEVIDALAKIARLKESHPTAGQRRTNVKGWKKFKKQVKRRRTINEPVQLARSPVSSPVNTSSNRSNSLGKKVAISISQDKLTTNKSPISSPVMKLNKEKPVDKPLEDASWGQQGSVGSSTSSSLSVHHAGSVEHETGSLSSPPSLLQPVTNDNSQLSEQNDVSTGHLDEVDVELIPQSANDMEDKITLQEALDTLKDASHIYNNDFGNREHQEEMMRLFKMLEGDHLDIGPTDLSVLEDLNGWRLAPKENM